MPNKLRRKAAATEEFPLPEECELLLEVILLVAPGLRLNCLPKLSRFKAHAKRKTIVGWYLLLGLTLFFWVGKCDVVAAKYHLWFTNETTTWILGEGFACEEGFDCYLVGVNEFLEDGYFREFSHILNFGTTFRKKITKIYSWIHSQSK